MPLVEPPLRVRALRRPEGKSRLGLAVGRRVGRAAVRNRWRRAIREAFRLHRHRLSCSYDLVVSVDWAASPDEVGSVEGAFLRIVEQLNRSHEDSAGTDTVD
jgi:ribonuclease P protein component